MKNPDLLNDVETLKSVEDFDDFNHADSAETEQREITVEIALHGQRLDKVLVESMGEFSRSYLQQLIEEKCVQINQTVIQKSAHKVRFGDQLRIFLRPTPQSQAFKPEKMLLDVVFEDEHLLVINKPVGLVVHPAAGNWSGTLLNGLLAHHKNAVQLPRAGIVHRLDKDTSGLMVVAKTRSCMDGLTQQIAHRLVRREYLALAHRAWAGAAHRKVDAAIGRDPRNRLRMSVVDLNHQSGKIALTDFEMLQTSDTHQVCWLLCKLHTGRTHQIRVHASHIGHSLLGDSLYGGQEKLGLTRQALHAWRLMFSHPILQTDLSFESLPPADLMNALSQLNWNMTQP